MINNEKGKGDNTKTGPHKTQFRTYGEVTKLKYQSTVRDDKRNSNEPRTKTEISGNESQKYSQSSKSTAAQKHKGHPSHNNKLCKLLNPNKNLITKTNF